MTTQSKTAFTPLTEVEMTNLAKIVEETLAISLTGAQHKKFRSVDLWKIQRKKRSIIIR